jgi:hypothetical protein
VRTDRCRRRFPTKKLQKNPTRTLTDPNRTRMMSNREKNSGIKRMVGATGFEPVTTRTPSVCATRLRYAPTDDSVKEVI